MLPKSTERAQSRSPRVLLVSSNFPPIHGGAGAVYDSICRYSDGQVIALSCTHDYATGAEIEGWQAHDAAAPYRIYRVRLLRPPHNSGGRLRSLFQTIFNDLPVMARVLRTVRDITKRHGIRIVCLGDLVYGGWLVFPLKYLFGLKVLIYTHGEEITTRSSGSIFERLRPRFLAHADSVVAVSSFTRDALKRLMGLPLDRIALIPNGVDPSRFSLGPKNHEIRKKLGLVGSPVILSVGRLVERKGFDRLIDAMPQILKAFPEAVCVIAGAGPMRNALEMVVREWRLESHVRFLGAVSDKTLRALYSTADIFALPNRTMLDGDTEGFGLVFLEANACGLPVVAGNAGGAPDAVTHEVNGLIVDGTRPDEIASAVIKVLRSPDLYARLCAGAAVRAREAAWTRRVEAFLEICDSLDPPPFARPATSG